MTDRDEISIAGLQVEGTIPDGLWGSYRRIGPSTPRAGSPQLNGPGTTVDAIDLRPCGSISYRRHRLTSDGPAVGGDAPDGPVSSATPLGASAANIIEFGSRLLALGAGAVVLELGADLRPAGTVDLAGQGRRIGAHPTLDPTTGELHLLASPCEPSATHQVISQGAMTRHTRQLTDAPTPIHHLTVTRERLVIFGRGTTGITSRRMHDPERIEWFPTETIEGRDVVAVHDEGPSVLIYTAGQVLERWTLEPGWGTARRHAIDAVRYRFGRINPGVVTSPVRYLYAVGAAGTTPFAGTQVVKHDLLAGRRTSRDFGVHRHPGEFIFVSDPQRPPAEDGGWLIGYVHDHASGHASLVVLDAADAEMPRVATIQLPCPVPYGHVGVWSATRPRHRAVCPDRVPAGQPTPRR